MKWPSPENRVFFLRKRMEWSDGHRCFWAGDYDWEAKVAQTEAGWVASYNRYEDDVEPYKTPPMPTAESAWAMAEIDNWGN